jgi:hypothetical protein
VSFEDEVLYLQAVTAVGDDLLRAAVVTVPSFLLLVCVIADLRFPVAHSFVPPELGHDFEFRMSTRARLC